MGKKWISYLVEKIYDRKEINEVATKFYAQLYEDKNKLKTYKISKDNPEEEEEVPQFLEEEVEAIIKNLKKDKATGADKISR